MNMVLLGPPGAGKGTIAAKVKDHFKIPHISTGDLFRAAIKNKTELGVQVKSILDSGDLVPDDLTVALVKERLKKDDTAKGYILDGFPRTIVQAEALGKIAKIDHVVNFFVPEDLIIKRLSGRRLCKECGAGYHVEYIKPKKEGVCDKCGGDLYTRKDDNIDSIQNRLDVYAKQTEPLINFYKEKGLLKDVDGSSGIDNVFTATLKVLK